MGKFIGIVDTWEHISQGGLFKIYANLFSKNYMTYGEAIIINWFFMIELV